MPRSVRKVSPPREKETTKSVKVSSPKSGEERLKALYRVSQKAKCWQPARDVFTSVKAHPTIFPLYDRATKVGGHPIERITLVHGPSSMGKTTFCHGLGLSFLQANNFYGFIDAEYTTPIDWLSLLMRKYADHPGFLGKRPKTYEETVDAVRELVTVIAEAREKGELDPETTGIIVVDSIRKLVPEKLHAKLLKAENGLDGASGRGAMIKAALNAQWLDELVPLLFHTRTALVFVAREYEQAVDLTKLNEPGGGAPDIKTGGGKAVIFESSIVARITRSWVNETAAKDSRVVGERHTVLITKSKVSGKEHKVERGYFHTSNGVLVPEGFDRARDVIELAIDAGVVQQNGGWYVWGELGERWQGMSNFVKCLTERPELLDSLEGESRQNPKGEE